MKETNFLKEAVKADDMDKIKILIDHSSKEEIDNAFIFSIKKSKNEISKFLLNKGANVNSVNKKGESALIIATSNINFNMVRFLLDNGANINFRDSKVGTALTIASKEYVTYDILELLVNRGANLDLKNKEGITPLIAASKGYKHLFFPFEKDYKSKNVKLLVSKDANLNLKSNDGFTALTFAMFNCRSEIVDFLVDKDAEIDINDKDDHGNIAIGYAINKGNENITKLLIDAGAAPKFKGNYENINHAVEDGRKKVIIQFSKVGADLHAICKMN